MTTGSAEPGNEFLAQDIVGHGAYLCVRAVDADVRRLALERLPSLAGRLELRNEFLADGAGAGGTIAFVRRHGATPGDIADEDVLQAQAVIHVASKRARVLDDFVGEGAELLAKATRVRVLRGELRPKNYTGAAMNRWAYEHAVVQQPGTAAPNAFLLPMSKTAEWWTKRWMERHTYFLPRYDDHGRMTAEGHALAAERGIACLLRRTYRSAAEPAPAGEYDFITYFECADADVPTFHAVCAALRDVGRNPEWRFVREGPTWQGRRVPSWDALLAG